MHINGYDQIYHKPQNTNKKHCSSLYLWLIKKPYDSFDYDKNSKCDKSDGVYESGDDLDPFVAKGLL